MTTPVVTLTRHGEERMRERRFLDALGSVDPEAFVTARLMAYAQTEEVIVTKCVRKVRVDLPDGTPWVLVCQMLPDGRCFLLTAYPWVPAARAKKDPDAKARNKLQAARCRDRRSKLHWCSPHKRSP